MKIVGLMLVRNEEWILGLSARAALLWCDALTLVVHNSTDATAKIVEELAAEYPGRISRSFHNEEHWNEMDLRQRLLIQARALEATHLALVDADEILTGNLISNIRAWCEVLGSGEVLEFPMIPCWRSLKQYRNDNSVWSNGRLSTVVRDNVSLTWKPTESGYHHHHRIPYGHTSCIAKAVGDGGVMHLQWASWRRVLAKHVWYRMMEVIRYPGLSSADQLNSKYNLALNEDNIRLYPTPDTWWLPYQDYIKYANVDLPPWHEEECHRLWKTYGADKFTGLHLHELIKPNA